MQIANHILAHNSYLQSKLITLGYVLVVKAMACCAPLRQLVVGIFVHVSSGSWNVVLIVGMHAFSSA